MAVIGFGNQTVVEMGISIDFMLPLKGSWHDYVGASGAAS